MTRDHHKVIASLRFMAEPLEARLLLYSYVTIQSPGAAQPLQITSGQTVTLTADIRQHDDVNTIQANPTGSVTFFWYPLKETSGPIIGTASNFTVITPFLDTQVTATFSLKSVSSFDGAASDNFGNYDILAGYSGDSNFPTNTSGSGFDNQVLRTAANDQGLYVPVDFVTPSSGSIAVTRQPVNTPGGSRFDPPVQVSVLDSAGSVNTSSTASITVALASTSTGTGTLSGTKTVAAVAGVATFTDLTVDKLGQYSLTFTDASGNTTASGLFQITGGKLVFLPPGPKDGSAGSPLKSFTVALENSKNKIITDDSSSVVTLTPIGLAAGPTITGNVVQLVNGKAVFSNLILQRPDLYKLEADDGGDTSATSSRFKITGDHLVFKTQPSDGDVNLPVPLTVGLYNAKNKLDVNATTTLGLTLNTISSGSSAQLQGTVSTPFVGGLAKFTATAGPVITAGGTFTLTATELELNTGVLIPTATTSSIISRRFKISGYHLKFIKQPVSKISVNDTSFSVWVALLDSRNHLSTGDTTHGVTLEFAEPNLRLGTRSIVTFSDVGFHGGIDKIQVPPPPHAGDYKLIAYESDAQGHIVAETTIASSRAFSAEPLKIFFFKQPEATASSLSKVSFDVGLKDFRDQLVATGPYFLYVKSQVYEAVPRSSKPGDVVIQWTDEINLGESGFEDPVGFVNGRADYGGFNIGIPPHNIKRIRLHITCTVPFDYQDAFSRVITVTD